MTAKKEEPKYIPPAGPFVVVPRESIPQIQDLPFPELLKKATAGDLGMRVSEFGPIWAPKDPNNALHLHPNWQDWGRIALFRAGDAPSQNVSCLYRETW